MKAAAPARAMRRRILRLVALAVLGGAGAGGASAQAPVRISIETAPAAALEPPLAQTPTVTPRSAFLRAKNGDGEDPRTAGTRRGPSVPRVCSTAPSSRAVSAPEAGRVRDLEADVQRVAAGDAAHAPGRST